MKPQRVPSVLLGVLQRLRYIRLGAAYLSPRHQAEFHLLSGNERPDVVGCHIAVIAIEALFHIQFSTLLFML